MAAKPEDHIAAIVLAGGLSQRMGALNKLHLDIDGTPMLRRTLEMLKHADLGEIVVVLGHEYQATQKLISDLNIRTVYNADYESGQMTSVHAGLGALQQPCSGVLVALGDQPALTVDDINQLTQAFKHRGNAEVIIPQYQARRGNPIIISDSSREDILAGKRKLGCRRFIENNPELVKMVDMSNPAVVIDLDTPEEYQNYRNSRQTDYSNPTVN